MNEKSLSATIDILATRKAEDFIARIKVVVQDALKNEWRPNVAGKAYTGDDIKAVLMAYATAVNNPDTYKAPKPTKDLVDQCRATIINELLSGLPKLRELAMMEINEPLSDSEE